jgi:hypothetical protein
MVTLLIRLFRTLYRNVQKKRAQKSQSAPKQP